MAAAGEGPGQARARGSHERSGGLQWAVVATEDEPCVSVVVPVRDGLEGLRRCLSGLGRQTLGLERFEVIVVDNGSKADPADIVRDFGFAQLVREGRPGSYAARNAGVRTARAGFIAFTDADCVPAADWLERGLAALRSDPRVGLVGGRVAVYPEDRSRPTMVELYELRHAFPQERYTTEVGFAATANAFTSREVFDATGGFLPDVASGGDREWGARVRAAGYLVTYSAEAVVSHPARRTWAEYLEKADRVRAGVAALRERGLIEAGARGTTTWRRYVPPVQTWLRAVRDPSLSASQTIKYCIAITVVRYTWLALGIRQGRRFRHGLARA